jgi:hypothetical protein
MDEVAEDMESMEDDDFGVALSTKFTLEETK